MRLSPRARTVPEAALPPGCAAPKVRPWQALAFGLTHWQTPNSAPKLTKFPPIARGSSLVPALPVPRKPSRSPPPPTFSTSSLHPSRNDLTGSASASTHPAFHTNVRLISTSRGDLNVTARPQNNTCQFISSRRCNMMVMNQLGDLPDKHGEFMPLGPFHPQSPPIPRRQRKHLVSTKASAMHRWRLTTIQGGFDLSPGDEYLLLVKPKNGSGIRIRCSQNVKPHRDYMSRLFTERLSLNMADEQIGWALHLHLP